MLKMDKCRIIESTHSRVHSTVTQLSEGVALAFIRENGELKVHAATGAAGEKFAGVSMSRHMTPSQAVLTVETTIPSAAPYEVTLADTPVEAPGVYIDGVAAPAGAPAAGEYLLAGAIVSFEASDAGKTVSITYRYNLTQAKARMLFGTDAVSLDMSEDFELSRIVTGHVYTDQYVTADDWSDDTTPIRLGADGKFTKSGTGTEIPSAVVHETPASAGGFLALHLNATA